MTPVARATTLLFVPGSRPDRFDSARSSGADTVVIDLEDAVAPPGKVEAREAARGWFGRGNDALVRVNAAGTEWFEDDIAMALETKCGVMLPKAEPGDALTTLAHDIGRPGGPLVALVETARGIRDADAVSATPGVSRLAFGSLDLAAELGVDPLDHEVLAHARWALVVASAAAGIAAPVDGVRAAVDDEAGLRDECGRASRLGFTGKLCIHPRQVPTARDAMAPSTEQVAWARRVLDEAHDRGDGAFAVDGAMVDRPVLERARALLARADRTTS